MEEWNLGIKNLFKEHFPSDNTSGGRLSCELLYFRQFTKLQKVTISLFIFIRVEHYPHWTDSY
jgi:hypothetical protein